VTDTASRSGDSLPDDWKIVQIAGALREHLPTLQSRYGVSRLELFGSYVRNDQHSASDLDVLVEYDRTPSLLELVALQDHLSDLLGVTVDLTMRSALRPDVRPYLLADAIAV
jgi:predicted nucleotidyltransferase